MKKGSKKSRLWWIIAIAVFVIAIYLNRSYAYFYDFIDTHKIMPLELTTNFQFKSQNPSSKNHLRYIALGDSLTYGVGVGEETQTFPYLIAQSLSKSAEVELVNLGIPGARTEEVKLVLTKLNGLNPNLITLLIGTNDTQSLETENTFKKNYQIILDKITANSQTKVVVINIPPLSHNIIFPYKYFADLRISRFNSIIDNLVKEKQKKLPNLIFINLYDKTKQQFIDDESLYSPDYFHPSAKGYKLWSQIINASLNY